MIEHGRRIRPSENVFRDDFERPMPGRRAAPFSAQINVTALDRRTGVFYLRVRFARTAIIILVSQRIMQSQTRFPETAPSVWLRRAHTRARVKSLIPRDLSRSVLIFRCPPSELASKGTGRRVRNNRILDPVVKSSDRTKVYYIRTLYSTALRRFSYRSPHRIRSLQSVRFQ